MKRRIWASWLPAGVLTASFLVVSCSSWLPDLPHIAITGNKANTSTPVASGTVSGIVVGDEPLAAKAGADMLTQGGSAADAAAAIYFTLSVTYPVAAGLGGGGICVVRDTSRNSVESFDFLPRDVRSRGPFAVPGNVRGFALLQSLYGRMHWQDAVVQGERLAQLGFPMSRALAERVAGSADIVRLDAGLAKVFMDESGNMHREGDMLHEPELGSTLTAIRIGGPNALYKGALTPTLTAYAAGQNGAIAADEFAGYAPVRRDARAITVGGETVFLPAERTGAGKLAAGVFASLAGRTQTISAADIASVVNQLLKDYGVGALPNDLGATGFAAVDNSGQAVACAVTMAGPFGSGRTVPGTGIALANAPGPSNTGLSVAFLTPVLAAGDDGVLTLAGAGAGGPDATVSILYGVAARTRNEETPNELESHNPAGPHLSVNMIVCEKGACHAIPTPGAYGMGLTAITQ